MTRLPAVGRNKTRLIPALGAEGAMAFHSRLARHAIGRASAFCLCGDGTRLEIRLTGGNTMEGRAWLGEADWRIQGEGGLGARMARAFETAFEEGAEKVVLIGTDCPRLDHQVLADAFAALERSDVVVGPALDGGYYLIGMKRLWRGLFDGVAWGGPEVLSQTMGKAHELGLGCTRLVELPDVDLPEDLRDGEEALSKGESMSVIIPALNEEAEMAATLKAVKQDGPVEVLVSIGESRDDTRRIAEGMGAKVIEGRSSRAVQMNRAAALARGETLMFLHADTLPPPGYPEIVGSMLARPGVVAGAFRLGLDDGIGAAAMIESLVDVRCRFLKTPYGDQGLFVRREVFDHLGGFPEVGAMEDLKMVRELKRLGRMAIADERVLSSSRRWQEGGLIRTFLRHQGMLAASSLGFSDELIEKMR
ncbi:TIGR04283 family arsenosugar biosynthesis glycosyltransferase [Haloferula sp.]|uniref:TIGR04283 family arsenosugar biosynthesis glycosyltransferase n=1 Tax=Haloferula sp. TaxID=2497595 RepID=UPI00329E2801